MPNVRIQYLPRIEVLSADYANFSFRKLHWASAGYHLLIYCWGLDNMLCRSGARTPKSMSQYLPKIEVTRAVYANFSFRKRPRASADYHLIIYCWDLDKMVFVGGCRKPKFTRRYLPKIEVPMAD